MFLVAMIGVPIVLAYTITIYSAFRGKGGLTKESYGVEHDLGSLVAIGAPRRRQHQRRVVLRHDWPYRGSDQYQDEHNVENVLIDQSLARGIDRVTPDNS